MKRRHRPSSRVREEIVTELFTCASCKWRNKYGECRRYHTPLQQLVAATCRDYGFREG